MASKVVAIFGASGGLGTAISPILKSAGYKLALHGNTNVSALESLKEEGSVSIHSGDISSEDAVSRVIREMESTHGRIDVLVNAAGITASGMSWKMEKPAWDKTIEVNLTGPFLTTKHVLPGMRENDFGRIINISSIVAQNGVVGTSAYAASKAGLIGMVKAISKEVANKNITVNNIALGYFSEGMIHELPEAMREEIKNIIPKKSFGKPEELAKLILYLASDDASYITGQTININGGLYA